ncbi:LacI family DNA-binding transcriptional regulator [Georgenia sp. Z1491]|uniref:LacI family DNA-binding transcriptional regulator n=1 Tax=Georgenia sp. Z1491 TaxID=3416707 RepID=UPI003CFA5E36
MTRIVDVAARAGVSTATVSRVLNGTKVRADLEEAVRRAVDELGYSANRAARSLRRQYSDVVALVIPDVENPFFTSVARGVEDVAQAAGLSLVLCNTDDDVEKEQSYLSVAESENMAGVILAPAGDAPDLTRLLGRSRAVVVIDREVRDQVDQVLFDNVGLGRRATELLLARGHTDVACITGPRTTSTAVERAAGWRDALGDAGIGADRLVHANFRVDGGRAAMTEMLAGPTQPDAVLATNNLVGVGVLQALAAWGGPRIEVGIVGDLPFATSDVADVARLPLNPREMGVRAARLLVDRIRGTAGEPGTHVLGTDP